MSPLVVQAWLIIAVTAWKCFQLARFRVEFPIVAVTVALMAEVIGQSVPSLFGEAALIETFGERPYRFLVAAVLAVALLFTSLFFQSSARAGTLTALRFRIEIAVAAVAIIATLIAITLQPAVLAGGGSDSASSSVADFTPGRIEHLYPYFLTINLYYIWASGTAAWYALAAARRARSYLRAGLVLAGGALGLLTVAVALRLASGAIVVGGHPEAVAGVRAAGPLIFIGLTLFFAGVSFPAVGTRARAGKVWLQRRRMFRRLDGLARRLRHQFPELTMRPIPAYSLLERAGLWQVGPNFYRRVIEIHDGLLQLSRYLDPGQISPDADIATQAGHVVAAMRARQQGHPPADHAVDLGIAGGTDSLDADGRALVSLVDTPALRGGLAAT